MVNTTRYGGCGGYRAIPKLVAALESLTLTDSKEVA